MAIAKVRAASARTALKGTAVALLATGALAGCGGREDGGGGAAETAPVAAVEKAVTGFGTTQGVRCEPTAGAKLDGLAVVRCGFEEEKNESGVMRAQDRCYVVRSGAVVDVTRDVPVGTSCTVSSP